ncbi:hypothetical protein ACPA9J_35320 [Pseudomonas aeruginosa]
MYLNGASNRVDASDPRLFPGKALDLALGTGHAPDFDEALLRRRLRRRRSARRYAASLVRRVLVEGRRLGLADPAVAARTRWLRRRPWHRPSPNAAEQGDHAWN